MSYLKDREIWLSNIPTGNPPSGYFWKFIQNGKVVVRDSSGNNQIMVATSGSQAITGSLTVTGGIIGTISSASYVEYSNVANKPTLVSGSEQITYSGLTGIPSGIVSGSSQVTYSGLTGIPSGIVSGSAQVVALGFATTGSNTFQANQTITGSLFITQNLVVAGSSSIQYISSSVVDIADNIITVNAFNPGVRFGGLAVADSGSSPRVSGSLLFDSIKDQWVFVHENSTAITSSVVLMGPETYNDLGNESYISANRLPKGSGIEHLRDSNITDTGTVVSVNSNTAITGSFTVVTGSAVELQVTNAGVNMGSALTDSHIISGSITINPSGLFVSGSGNVGIGTTSPSWKLQVETTDVTAAMFRSNAVSTILGIDNSAADGDPQLKFYINDIGTFTLGVDDSDGDKFKIGTSDLTTNTRLTIDSSGNVGIGTASPGEKLDVVGGGLAAGNGTIKTGITYSSLGLMGTFTNHDLGLLTNGSTKMTITSGGNVGIGTTSPGTKLEVSSTAPIGDRTLPHNILTLTAEQSNAPYGGFGGAILFKNRSYVSGLVESSRIRSVIYDDGAPNNFGGGLWFETTPTPGGTLTQSLKIDYRGQSTFKSSFYDVAVFNSTYGQSDIVIQNNGSSFAVFGSGVSVTSTAAADDTGIGTAGLNKNIVFATGTSYLERMRITSGGNVGIGTASPYALLSVYSGTAGDRILIDSSTGSGSNGSIAWGAGGTPNISARIKGTDDGFYGTHLIFETRGSSGPATNTIERMRINSGGAIVMGNTTNYSDTRLSTVSAGTTSATYSFIAKNSTPSDLFIVRSDGLVGFPRINDFTTGNSPNTWINPSSSYGIYINTSSIRYKKDIVNYDKGLSVVNQLRPVYYKGKSEVDGDKQFAGFIAEEIDELGLTEFVNYLEDGRPNSLSYPNMVVLLTKALQEQQTLIESLKSRIEILEQ